MGTIDNLKRVIEAEHFRIVWQDDKGWHCWNTYSARTDVIILRGRGIHEVWGFPTSFSRHHAIKAAQEDKTQREDVFSG